MAKHPYLIALALIEQEGKRALPIGGKSLKTALAKAANPEREGAPLIQDLLLRIFQKSDAASLNRAYGEKSLLLIQISMYSMQEKIPLLKAEWINNGNSEKLISELQTICEGVWTVTFTKGSGTNFESLF